MKQHKLITLITIIIFSATYTCYGQAVGSLLREEITTNMVVRSRINYMTDEQVYTTGVGGITFNYPAGWFTQTPIVQISLEQNSSHPTNLAYVAEVSANTTTSTTIMVYQINSGLVNEAPTGVITVCLFALDNPL